MSCCDNVTKHHISTRVTCHVSSPCTSPWTVKMLSSDCGVLRLISVRSRENRVKLVVSIPQHLDAKNKPMFAEYRLEAHNECPHQQHTTRAQPERTFSLCIAATFDPTQRSAARYGHGEDRRKIRITGKMQICVVTCCQNSDKADLLLRFQRKYIAEVRVPFYKSTRLK